jgi:[ribosomal protein S18]-alanine N-acetyltransferase
VSPTLRRMRWWDVAVAARLEAALFPADPWTEAGFWSELAGVPATRYYVVAEEAGSDGAGPELVGYAGLMAVGPEADVQTVAVRADRQGAGVGQALVDALLVEARRRGCGQVLLEVREDNAAGRALYARLGFEQVGVRRGYYGPGTDALVLRLRLAGRPEAGVVS